MTVSVTRRQVLGGATGVVGGAGRPRTTPVNQPHEMFHPMHVHGHTFQLAGGGPRKDTVIVRPRAAPDVVLDADNPGQWMTHCHNIYDAETGMVINLAYRQR